MIHWELTDNEVGSLKTFLRLEKERQEQVAKAARKAEKRDRAETRIVILERLLKGLDEAAEVTESFDVLCYCDTNYVPKEGKFQCSWRVNDNPVSSELFDAPRHSEYFGIKAVLRELKERGIKGKVAILTDAARCVNALHKGLGLKVRKHSENQVPRLIDLGKLYDESVALIKDLKNDGCEVELRYKHRSFINEALNINRRFKVVKNSRSEPEQNLQDMN